MSLKYTIVKAMRGIKCSVLGHDYKILKYYDANMQKLICKRCCKMFGINHDVRAVIEWDDELESVAKLCYPNK